MVLESKREGDQETCQPDPQDPQIFRSAEACHSNEPQNQKRDEVGFLEMIWSITVLHQG